MATNSSTRLLLAGESSWEIWTVTPELRSTLHSAHPVRLPSEIGKLPQGDLIFLFPVKSFTALPMQVPTGDSGLFHDLAATHAERAGLRPDPFAGQLTDVFPLLTNSERSTFLNVILRSPQPGELPAISPKAFDISPRARPVRGNALAVWRELGSWVFAVHSDGKLLYCQATSVTSPAPDDQLIREIRIALAQLSMQCAGSEPSRAVIWTSDPDTDTSGISRSLSLQTEIAPLPAPVLPDPLSRLLPADVRAARRAARKRQNLIFVTAILAMVYLGTIGYLVYNLWKIRSTTADLREQVNLVAPQQAAFREHISKWDELEYGVDLNHNTVDILNRIARSIPPGSGLRLTIAEISATEILLVGEAPQPQAVNQFSLNLTKNNDLAAFTWDTPEPRQSNRGWAFRYNASAMASTP